MSDALLEKEKVEETVLEEDMGAGDHDRFTHAFRNKDVDEAMFTGKPAVALCGKKSANPMGAKSKFPVCPTCKEIYGRMKG